MRADIKAGISGQTVGVNLVSITTLGGSASSVMVAGPVQAVGSVTLLGADMPTGNTVAPAAAAVNAGVTNYTVWSRSLSISTRAASLKGLTLKMIGSAPFNSLANVKLTVDGSQVATGMVDSMGYVNFDSSASPYNLTTGSHIFEVRADIVGGANRDFYMSMEQASDLRIEDSQVMGANVTVTTNSGSAALNINGGKISVNNGTLTITQDTSFNNVTTLVGGASNVKMAAFKFTAYGEDVKVTSLTFSPSITSPVINSAMSTNATTPTLSSGAQTWTVTSTSGMYVGQTLTTTGATTQAIATVTSITNSTTVVVSVTTAGTGVATGVTSATQLVTTGTLSNVGLYVNGAQVGTIQTATNGVGTLSFNNLGTNLYIATGQTIVVEIRGDVSTSGNVSYVSGGVKFDLVAGTNNVQGITSGQTVGSASNGGQSLTISSSNVTFASASGFAASTKAPNQAGVKIGSFSLQTGSAEGIVVTNITVGLTGTMIGANQLTNLTVKDASTGAMIDSVKGNPSGSNNYSASVSVPVSSTKTFDVYADFGSSAAGYTAIPSMTLTYRGSSSNLSNTTLVAAGITTTANVAVLVAGGVTLNTGDSPVGQLVVGTTTSNYKIASFNFKVNNSVGGAIVKDVTFAVPANTVSFITMNGKTASVVGTSAIIYNVGATVPADASGISLPVTVTFVCVGTANGCSANSPASSTAQITGLTYFDGATTQTLSSITAISNVAVIVGSKPTLSIDSVQKTGLVIGSENKIGEVTISADAAGQIKINQITFALSTSGITTPVFTTMRLADGNATIAGSSCTTAGVCTLGVTPNGYAISAGSTKTFSLYGTITGTPTASTVVTVSSSVTAAGLWWDDSMGGAINLNGQSVYNFPTASYSIRQ